MLLELRIRNFAIIDEVALEFGAGLNVLSGETGAGKTIIMNALGLLIGGRASPEMIRADKKDALVEGLFELDGEAPMPDSVRPGNDSAEREILIKRIIAESSRSRVMINDELATVQSLARIGGNLVQVYGQHEQQALLRTETHLAILDRYAGLETALNEYREAFKHAHELHQHLAELDRRRRERDDLLELARFRVGELERAGLAAGEDEELAANRTILANAAKLAAAAHEAEQLLYGIEGAAIDSIARAQVRLAEAAALDSSLSESTELITSARASLEEAARILGSYAERIEADPARLEQIEDRLQDIQRLKKKYGGSIERAIETLERSRAEIAELETLEESRAGSEAEFLETLDNLWQLAHALNKHRRQNAAELKRRMEAELKTLEMRNAVFEARFASAADGETAFTRDGVTLGPGGYDSVEFYLSANLGQPAMPLGKIASGGELSRVMLALKTLEARRRGVATLIFDEVDAGIGGSVAEVVGRKLKQLAKFHQLLCVTHLPQIAAFADKHFVVEKEQRRGTTASKVVALERGDRIEELARMLGGVEITEKIRHAARELLERAQRERLG
jgi:DNA repair protein RecN (Recombination protein N)